MDELHGLRPPAVLAALQAETELLEFDMASDPRTGALLRTLAAAKPGGRILEVGTGTGIGAAWLLDGMDTAARLDTVESSPALSEVAQRHLGHDRRIRFHVTDGLDFLRSAPPAGYDLVFADAMPGKYEGLEYTLASLRPGGLILFDDMLPQANWPAGHAPRVAALLAALEELDGFTVAKLAWATGLILVARSNSY